MNEKDRFLSYFYRMELHKYFTVNCIFLLMSACLCANAQAQGTPRVIFTAPAASVDDSIPDLEQVVQKGQFPESLRDGDKDGIADLDDNCPATPPEWPRRLLDHCGCPLDPCTLDEDSDGVNDCLDTCPGTLKGLAVLANGCPAPITEPVRLTLDVKFGYATAQLQETYVADIEKLRALMVEFPELSVTLEGHTDSKGSASYNLALSQVRARVVRNAVLEDSRIARARVKAVGYGEDRPIASNKTEAGRALNRRTMAEISAERLKTPPNSGTDTPDPLHTMP